jgi:hypothetical protein
MDFNELKPINCLEVKEVMHGLDEMEFGMGGEEMTHDVVGTT